MTVMETQGIPAEADAVTEATVDTVVENVVAAEAEVVPFVDPLRFAQQLRIVEAILFAASAPLDEATIARHLAQGPAGQGAHVPTLMKAYKESLSARGVQLLESSNRYSLRTASDLSDYLRTESVKPVKLSRAMSETLAIIAYHQPVTRAEVETIRGVATSKGTLDYLMQLGWVRPGRRRETPGRPLTWITTPAFLDHFGLGSTGDLPGMAELRAAGLLDAQAAATYGVIAPSVDAELPEALEGDGTFGGEPEFLPSEETIAAQSEEDEVEDEVEAEEAEAESETETVMAAEPDEFAEESDESEIAADDADDFDDEDDEDFDDEDEDDDDDDDEEDRD